MRPLLLILFCLAPALAQPFTAGIKGGVPMNDFVSAVQSGTFDYTSSTQRYIVGGMAELRLPFSLAVEFDALYRNFHYNGSGTINSLLTTSSTSGGNWEFPLVLKYRFKFPVVRPYAEGGVAFDKLSGLKQTFTQETGLLATPSGNPTGVTKTGSTGWVLGAGLDIHAVFLHISPELRYTRWFDAPLADTLGLHANQNQAEFLVGFTF